MQRHPVIHLSRCFLLKVVNSEKLLIIFTKSSTIDISEDPKYAHEDIILSPWFAFSQVSW